MFQYLCMAIHKRNTRSESQELGVKTIKPFINKYEGICVNLQIYTNFRMSEKQNSKKRR